MLIVANLERSSANLADKYASIMLGLATYLQSAGLHLENMGLIATYGDHWGPRLLLGRRAGSAPSPILQLLLDNAIAGNTNVQDYDHLLPIIGAALGTTTLRKIAPRPAPMFSADHTRMVGVAFTP